jgi:hypothetical protein
LLPPASACAIAASTSTLSAWALATHASMRCALLPPVLVSCSTPAATAALASARAAGASRHACCRSSVSMRALRSLASGRWVASVIWVDRASAAAASLAPAAAAADGAAVAGLVPCCSWPPAVALVLDVSSALSLGGSSVATVMLAPGVSSAAAAALALGGSPWPALALGGGGGGVGARMGSDAGNAAGAVPVTSRRTVDTAELTRPSLG